MLDYLRLRRCLVFKHRKVGIMKPNGSYIPLPAEERGIADIIGCTPAGTLHRNSSQKEGQQANAGPAGVLGECAPEERHRDRGVQLG